jgi:hypothetical protein
MRSLFLDVAEMEAGASFDHEQVVVVLPFIDMALARRVETVLSLRALCDGLLVLVDDSLRLGFIKVANLIFAHSRSKYFGYLAQDVFPGDGWLRIGLETLDESGADLLPFSDGRFYGNIATFGLLRRSWARSLYHNFVFYPEYQSHFGDTELSAIAWSQGRAIFNPGCIMCEVDYEKHTRKNNAADEALYRARARTGFNGLIAPFDPD